ncbi:MAG: cyclase family protein [Lentisphaerota bacterium]
MKLYDISLPISNDLFVWPGDPSVSLIQAKSISKGDQCNVSQLQMGVHTGTHIDAPYHFINDGARVESIPMETFIGTCLVIEVDSKTLVEKQDLLKYKIGEHSRILLKTRNTDLWANNVKSFDRNFVALAIDAAQYLIEMNILLVGIDYLSIESFHSANNPVHKLLLKNNITILEGLNLSKIKPGVYELICLPLKLQGCEGSPARVLLRELADYIK